MAKKKTENLDANQTAHGVLQDFLKISEGQSDSKSKKDSNDKPIEKKNKN